MNGAKSLALTCSHDAPARSELAWALVSMALMKRSGKQETELADD
jgi:hypothetical protein